MVTFADQLRSALPELRILDDAVDMEGYRFDETAFLHAGRPAAVCFPRSTDGRRRDRPGCRGGRRADRAARRGHGPVRRRRGHRWLRHSRLHGHEHDPRDRSGQPDRHAPAGRHQRRPEQGRGRARSCLSAGSGELRDMHHRRQPGRELGRPALRQVRRHARLGDGSRGRTGRRLGHPHRRQEQEGCRGLRPDRRLRGLRGNARVDHRRRRCACCPSGRPT